MALPGDKTLQVKYQKKDRLFFYDIWKKVTKQFKLLKLIISLQNLFKEDTCIAKFLIKSTKMADELSFWYP